MPRSSFDLLVDAPRHTKCSLWWSHRTQLEAPGSSFLGSQLSSVHLTHSESNSAVIIISCLFFGTNKWILYYLIPFYQKISRHNQMLPASDWTCLEDCSTYPFSWPGWSDYLDSLNECTRHFARSSSWVHGSCLKRPTPSCARGLCTLMSGYIKQSKSRVQT